MLGAGRNTIKVNRAGRQTAEDRKQAVMVSTVRVELVRQQELDDILTISGEPKRSSIRYVEGKLRDIRHHFDISAHIQVERAATFPLAARRCKYVDLIPRVEVDHKITVPLRRRVPNFHEGFSVAIPADQGFDALGGCHRAD